MIVVDTNILAYHCLPGSRNAETEQLLAHDPVWAAPLLWRSEFRNVLAGFLRHRQLTVAQANAVIALATETLHGGEHWVADDAVMALVARSSCTAYDCEFVALALALNCTLVTDDKALLNAFPDVCQSLADTVRGL